MSGAARRLLWLLPVIWPGVALAANTTVSAQVCPQAFAPTTLSTLESDPTTATSAAFTGTTQPDASVQLTVNATLRATVTADGSGNFGATLPLDIGDNAIVASASDGAFCGDTSSSPPLLLHRSQVPPASPNIVSPVSGYTTTSASALVQGSAEPGAGLRVYDGSSVVATVTVGGSGTFSVSVPLNLGDNQIQADATNPAGTGPLSAAVTVTRTNQPLQQPAPTVSTPPPPPAAPPAITSPSSGITTSGDSITLQLTGPPGSTAIITDNGAVVSTVKIDATGSASVAIALALGDNAITVSINGRDAGIIIHHPAYEPMAPVLTGPSGDTTTRAANIKLSGTATPGATITIFNGQTKVATVTADTAGRFGATIPLHQGLNLIHAEGPGPLSSDYLQITRSTEPAAGRAVKGGLTALLTIPTAAIILTGQAVGSVLGAVAGSPVGRNLVLILAIAAGTAGNGLLGLELILFLPGLLRAAFVAGAGASRGRVVDSVTGRPLAFSRVSAGSKWHTLTGRDGRFALPIGKNSHLEASRPGYVPTKMPHPTEQLTLEPSAARHSLLRAAADLLFGAISWGAMLMAFGVGVMLTAQQPGLSSFTYAAAATLLLGLNLVFLVHQPRYRWGRLRDSSGRPIAGALVTLTADFGAVTSRYKTGPTGRYTLYAAPGRYQLQVTHGEQLLHEEPVTVRRRATYLGWKILVLKST